MDEIDSLLEFSIAPEEIAEFESDNEDEESHQDLDNAKLPAFVAIKTEPVRYGELTFVCRCVYLKF